MHYRFKQTKVLLFGPLLLILALVIACGSSAPEPENTQQPVVPDTPGATTPGDTGASVATAVPASTPEESGITVPQMGRLRIAFTVPPQETNLPWIGPRSLLTQLSPMVETLLDIDPDTGEFMPMLATRWEMAPDGKSWTMDLREGVTFHSEFGEFDAQDVAHMRFLMGPQEGNLNSFRNTWATTVNNVEIVDDHRVVFQLDKPDPGLDFFLSLSGDLVMLSKNQWDQEGQDGLEQRLIGTGPYEYLEREVGQSISFSRVPYEHWRVPNADFQELELVWAPESATRLAMLLTQEAHMAELPRDVLAQAVSEGHGNLPKWSGSNNDLDRHGRPILRNRRRGL